LIPQTPDSLTDEKHLTVAIPKQAGSKFKGEGNERATNRKPWMSAITMRMTETMSSDFQHTKAVIEKFLREVLIDIDPEIAIVSKNACSGDLIVMKTDGSWLTIRIENA
jgi:hypothetical protein